jgi:hypothetical protein
MSQKVARPAISAQVQRELWARAAGRCEFRGCNKLLYKDELTQGRSNLAVISHIVAYSPDGPRGDAARSRALQQDIRNLMLTCRVHGKIIDDKAWEAEYPEDLLREFKREHEQRVRMLTETTEDAQTHVLLLQAPIGRHEVAINETDAFRAILPRYPAEEEATLIDLSGLSLPADSRECFCYLAECMAEEVRGLLHRRAGRPRIKCLSVFALAPVPLLVHLGHLLGDIARVDLYQRHRDRQDWTWPAEEEVAEFYEVLMPDAPGEDGRAIAVLLSVSDTIGHGQVTAALAGEPLVYEIRARHPGHDFLRSRKRLEMFGYEARRLLSILRERHGHDRPIHLFAAVPAPVAIEFGRGIKEYDAPFLVYQYRKAGRSYYHALTVNPHAR